MPLLNINRKTASEKMWKWRYKIQHIGDSGEKTLSDFSSSESGDSKRGGPAAVSSAAAASNSKNGEFGASASIKTLYEGPNSREDYYNWVDYPPRQMSKSAARAQERVAIKVYKVKDTAKPVISGKFSLRYHMLEIQNPMLVAAIAEILKKQDSHLDISDNARFSHPFRELWFGYDDIVAKHRSLEETEPADPLKPYLLLLIRLLDDVFADTRVKLKALKESGLISFKLAWTLFPKDKTVITWGNNCELLSKVDNTSYHSHAGKVTFTIHGHVLRFDGRGFLWETYSTTINEFGGNRPITELEVYPLALHETAADVRARSTARGRKVLDYQGLTYAKYSGIAIQSGVKEAGKHNVEGRVLIDVIGYNRHHLAQGAREGTDPQTKKRQLVVGDDEDTTPISTMSGNANITLAPASASTTVKRLGVPAQERNKKAMLELEAKEPLLMYMFPLIQGYALKNKLWVSFFIEDIETMVWNDEAFEHLVYNEQQKDLIMSFVESHCSNAAARKTKQPKAMEDVIAGKGQGLVMLLSGPPGTGKTLMAEAVADRSRRPLFYLQAEDLGISAAVLGANIKKVFQMATEWDAVILLDEADVFMAERHPQDIARNELVSIFLRELEYFRGIIFLTTNLYSTIDSAFRSRVSLHLLFNALTPEARTLVWRKFLDRLAPSGGAQAEQQLDVKKKAAVPNSEETVDESITDEDIKELAAWQLNGREIKTAVKMTRTWCDHKGYEMTLSRLENGIKVTSPHASKASHEQDTSLYDE